MPVQRLAPDGLFKPSTHTQLVVAAGRRMVFVSGQVSMDAQGKLVAPGDLAGQARQVGPASTLVGVQALAEPGYLIEVEAIAVTDDA